MATKNYYSIDAFDKLFCKCDGTTTTFVDSSTANPKTITANGNATQLSLPTGVTSRTAGFFNGTSDAVIVPSVPALGSGDFNITGYWNFTSAGTMDLIGQGDSAGQWRIRRGADGKLKFTISGGDIVAYTWSPTPNVWYKISARRVSGTMYLAIDDSDVHSASNSTDITSTSDVAIGYVDARYAGWLKNLTITKASTLVLDMRFDSPATSPLAPAIAFDGTGDELTVGDHADFDMTDFTLEGWFRFESNASNRTLIELTPYNSNGAALTSYGNNASYTFDGYVRNTRCNGTSPVIPVNTWTHFCLMRSGTNAYGYVNGTLVSTTNVGTTALAPTGIRINGNGVENFWAGNAREIRISNNARYSTTGFTPSQSGFTVDGNTLFYVKGDEDNGTGGNTSTDIKDSSTSPKTVTCVNDTKIKYTEDYRSCIFKDETGKFPYPVSSAKVDFFAPFGTGVYYGTDAGGGYLSASDASYDADFNFGSGAFAIEMYVRPTSTDEIGFAAFTSGTNKGWAIDWVSSKLRLRPNAATVVVEVASLYSVNTWQHLSWTRENNDWRIFHNGSLLVTTNSNTTIADASTGTLLIGDGKTASGGSWGNSGEFNGLLDNIRISKGVARYTASFNPPEPKLSGNKLIMWVN